MKKAAMSVELPLEGIRVLDFSQFLAGPVCALRLADLGADVIKIERPDGGDLCRKLVVADQVVGNESLLFHTINRNKSSVAADLKDENDLAFVKSLVSDADVMLHNFRPGVMERIGLSYDDVNALNSKIVYGVVSGYGTSGLWRDSPGQDLLAQARSGLSWLTGSDGDGPIPFGISITDLSAGMHLAQGILAALFRQARKNKGALVEVSLLASAMDLQFEQFTSYLNDAGIRQQPKRSKVRGASVHASAPYGLYETLDGYIAIAMTPIIQLLDLLDLHDLASFTSPDLAYRDRDRIKSIIQEGLLDEKTGHWLSLLEPAGVWCAEVLDWPSLEASGVLSDLGVIQKVQSAVGDELITTTCPIKLDGKILSSNRGAPSLGQHNHTITPEPNV